MSNFTILSRIYPNKQETQTLNKIFKYAYHIYSQLFNEVNLIFQNHKEELKNNKRWEKYKLLKQLKLNEYWLQERMKKHRRRYEKNVDSTIGQKIASNLWKSIDKYCFWNWKWLRKKKYYQFTSIEWKSNEMGLMTFSKDKSSFMKYKKHLLLKISQFDNFQLENIRWKEISYCRLVRIQWNKRWKYSFQIIMKWESNKKYNIGNKKAWIDFWLNYVALVDENQECKLIMTWEWNYHQDKIAKLQKIISQEYLSLNPECYDETWKIKEWVILKCNEKIKKYNKKISYLRRKQAKKLSSEQNQVRKQILIEYWELYWEKLEYREIKKREKWISLWKIVQRWSPWQMRSKLEEKWKVIYVDKYNYKASQYNHFTNEYAKPKLSERVKNIWENKVQRDLYSAYLLLNHKKNLKEIDRKKCIENFNTFLENHNQLISELKENWLTYPQSFWLDNF